MAKKKIEKTVEQELDERKRAAWQGFKEIEYDSLAPEQREQMARNLYETMSTYPAPPAADIPFDFWKEYENTDEIKEINRFVEHVNRTSTNLPKNPTKESWLDKDRGIVPNMKREWKTKLDSFKSERVLRKILEKKANEYANAPENKDKKFSINATDWATKAIDNIEKTAYKPTREKIEAIETEIYNRLGIPKPKTFTQPTKKVEQDGNDNTL